jgi:hypothetical protein
MLSATVYNGESSRVLRRAWVNAFNNELLVSLFPPQEVALIRTCSESNRLNGGEAVCA